MTSLERSGASPSLAIAAGSLARWTGGIDFLRICISALNSASPGTTWSVLLPSKSIQASLKALAKNAIKILGGKQISNEPMTTLRGSGLPVNFINYRNTTSGLLDAMRRCRAQALFPCDSSLGRAFPLPWIGYIPDLQHKRLPQWFSDTERKARDEVFTKILAEALVVVVNAAAVVRDIEEYYPGHRARLIGLPFCPPANLTHSSETSGPHVRAAYRLPASYFLVSNQFWIHKSHETAFMALRRVRDAGHDVHLVCTGNTHDFRWPDHFNNLKDVIEKIKLRDYIHILGLIPKGDQLAVMRESLAVVQPTLFEGGPGGGAVYDAVSMGKPSIVSDIPVNREIDIGVVRFFAAGSVEDLASKMIDLLVNPPRQLDEMETLSQLDSRKRELGGLLLNIANLVANPGSSPRRA